MTLDGKRIRLGVDIGGTFTDVAMEIGDQLHSTKVLTTPDEPERAILESIGKVCAEAGVAAADIDMILHGTTLATNALIERKGAKTAFVTTKGFRDVVEMRTESRFEQYDLNIVLPAPLISREHRFPVAGRIAASGRELAPLDETGLRALAERIAGEYESVAIGFLHSYVNDAHERRAREIFAEVAPDLSISLSSEVSPQMREFERFNTVCANAFVKPLMASYLNRLAGKLEAEGATCPVFLLHSGGGLISLETASEFPVRLLESGPAGGAIYAADVAARYGLDRVLSYDMGGTTAKICLIENQTPRTARTFEVARTTRFKKGSGMPISIPVIEMVEIGAGGGSLASVDSMRQLRVGPESAGSEPGPACYGRGGERAAVTDADLLLGKLDPDDFAGGAFSLSVEKAEAALAAVGEPVAMNAGETAVGVVEVVDENDGQRRARSCRREWQRSQPVHDDCFRRRSAASRRAPVRKAGNIRASHPAGCRRRLGNRFPARPVRIRGGARRLFAARTIRRRLGEPHSRRVDGRSRGGCTPGRQRYAHPGAQGIHAL